MLVFEKSKKSRFNGTDFSGRLAERLTGLKSGKESAARNINALLSDEQFAAMKALGFKPGFMTSRRGCSIQVRKAVLLILVPSLNLVAAAQSPLPSCEADRKLKLAECSGLLLLPNGSRYQVICDGAPSAHMASFLVRGALFSWVAGRTARSVATQAVQ